MVKIVGLDMEDIDEDTIDNVFSNEDQGGGDIANIDIQGDTVYITFAEATGTYVHVHILHNKYIYIDKLYIYGRTCVWFVFV